MQTDPRDITQRVRDVLIASDVDLRGVVCPVDGCIASTRPELGCSLRLGLLDPRGGHLLRVYMAEVDPGLPLAFGSHR